MIETDVSAGRLEGRFIARIVAAPDATPDTLPADPLDLGGGAIVPGACIEASFSIADTGYASVITGQDAMLGYSDGRSGLIGVQLRFGAARYTQSDSAFQEIRYASAAADGTFGTVFFNANNVLPQGEATQTMLSVTPAQALRGASLRALIAQPFSGTGTLTFSEFRDHQVIGGFTATVESLTSWYDDTAPLAAAPPTTGRSSGGGRPVAL